MLYNTCLVVAFNHQYFHFEMTNDYMTEDFHSEDNFFQRQLMSSECNC